MDTVPVVTLMGQSPGLRTNIPSTLSISSLNTREMRLRKYVTTLLTKLVPQWESRPANINSFHLYTNNYVGFPSRKAFRGVTGSYLFHVNSSNFEVHFHTKYCNKVLLYFTFFLYACILLHNLRRGIKKICLIIKKKKT